MGKEELTDATKSTFYLDIVIIEEVWGNEGEVPDHG
jgi:hypothetical protein